MSQNSNLSLNKLTKPLVENLITNADSLRLEVSNLNDGTCIIDPGTTWYQSNLVERLKPHLDQRSPVTTILLTHRHFDTCAAAPYIADQFGASIRIHEDAVASLSGGDLFTTWASRYDSDMPIINALPLKDGEIISLGDVEIEVKPKKAYNLLVTSHWSAIILRSREGTKGISINALGFAGYI